MISGLYKLPGLQRLLAWAAAREILPKLRGRLACCSPWARSRKARLAASFAEVEKIMGDLEEVSAQLDERFLETANKMLDMDRHGDLFVKQSERLVDVASGRTGGSEIFMNSMQVLEPPLQFLNDSHAQMTALLTQLKTDNERIVSLIAGRDDLQRTMAPLKYIQTSFRVEAAPLGPEVQAMFTSLTQEIEKLHNQVSDLFTTKYEELQHIQRTIGEVICRLEVQTADVWRNIERDKAQIDGTLGKLQFELTDNQKRKSSIAGLSGQISGEIQKVVTGLQFQDIIAQRLQHTNKALAEVRAKFDGSAASIEFLEQACRLQSGQIHSVRQDLLNAEKSIKDGVKNLLGQISSADANCVSMKEFESLTTSADGMVQVLLDVMETVRKQISTTTTGCSTACETLRPIGGMASDLTKVVHDLSLRIHLIGLNAQVQAVQVKDGMGLEVLSARTSEISRETNHISSNMAKQLDHIVSGLSESLRELERLETAAGSQKVTLDEQGGGIEQRLHTLRDSALSALVDVFDLLNGIREQGKLILATVDYVATADESLAKLESKLDQVAQLATERLGNRRRTGNIVSHFAQDYTMDSERKVFENVVAANGARGQEVAAATAANGTDVELFDAFDSAAVSAIDRSVTNPKKDSNTSANGSNVELF